MSAAAGHEIYFADRHKTETDEGFPLPEGRQLIMITGTLQAKEGNLAGDFIQGYG
jgi:hypothetical protein